MYTPRPQLLVGWQNTILFCYNNLCDWEEGYVATINRSKTLHHTPSRLKPISYFFMPFQGHWKIYTYFFSRVVTITVHVSWTIRHTALLDSLNRWAIVLYSEHVARHYRVIATRVFTVMVFCILVSSHSIVERTSLHKYKDVALLILKFSIQSLFEKLPMTIWFHHCWDLDIIMHKARELASHVK